MFGCFWFWKVWLYPTLGCLLRQQRMKSHCTEFVLHCPAARTEENVLASHSTAPGRVCFSEMEESFLKEGGDSCSFLWKPLFSLCLEEKHGSRVISSLSQLISSECLTLLFPCISKIALPSLLCSNSHLHFWRVINTLTNAGLCPSNLKIRKAANSEDQTTNSSCCDAADEGLWNTTAVHNNYHLGETFGLLMHQIYPLCSTDPI